MIPKNKNGVSSRDKRNGRLSAPSDKLSTKNDRQSAKQLRNPLLLPERTNRDVTAPHVQAVGRVARPLDGLSVRRAAAVEAPMWIASPVDRAAVLAAA